MIATGGFPLRCGAIPAPRSPRVPPGSSTGQVLFPSHVRLFDPSPVIFSDADVLVDRVSHTVLLWFVLRIVVHRRCFRLPRVPFRSRNSSCAPDSRAGLCRPIMYPRIRVLRRFCDTCREESYPRAFRSRIPIVIRAGNPLVSSYAVQHPHRRRAGNSRVFRQC